jgi:hypothetical protein
LPSEFVPKTNHTDGISVLRKIRQEIIKAFFLWIPTDNQTHPKRFPIDEPFHFQFGALLFGKFRDDSLKITVLTGFEALAVLPIGVDHPGIQARFASHDKEAAMAVDVSQVGQIEIPPVRQQ